MTTELKPCACGAIPPKLHIAETQSAAWLTVTCLECGEWTIEFRCSRHNTESEKMEEAIEAWNAAPRPAERVCVWTETTVSGTYETSCGNMRHHLPIGFYYCGYCAGKLEVKEAGE